MSRLEDRPFGGTHFSDRNPKWSKCQVFCIYPNASQTDVQATQDAPTQSSDRGKLPLMNRI